MSITDWVFAVEFGFLFGSVALFGWWQLRQLDKLDAEDAARAEEEAGTSEDGN